MLTRGIKTTLCCLTISALFAGTALAQDPTPVPAPTPNCKYEKKTCKTEAKKAFKCNKTAIKYTAKLTKVAEQHARNDEKRTLCRAKIEQKLDQLAANARPRLERCGILTSIINIENGKFIDDFLSEGGASGVIASAVSGIVGGALQSIASALDNLLNNFLNESFGPCSSLQQCTLRLPPITGDECQRRRNQCAQEHAANEQRELRQREAACRAVSNLGRQIEVIKVGYQTCDQRHAAKAARINSKQSGLQGYLNTANQCLATQVPVRDAACAVYTSSTCGGAMPYPF